MVAIALAGNVWSRKILPPLETLLGITHLLFLPITVIVLVVMAPHSSNSFVWATTTTGLSGWTNPGVQWCIGLLTPAFTLVSIDGVIHMSNEVHDPARKVPKSMIWSILINGALAFLMVITLLYTIGDPEAALTSTTGYPIIQIFYQATGSKAGTVVLTSMIIWAGMGSMFGSFASVTRLTCQYLLFYP